MGNICKQTKRTTCRRYAERFKQYSGDRSKHQTSGYRSIGFARSREQATKSDTTYTLTDTEQSYTVQQGDTLSEIAKRYGTTADLLSAYNNIESTAIIQVGATLKIPPANVADEITDSKTQSVPDTDTTVAATDEP